MDAAFLLDCDMVLGNIVPNYGYLIRDETFIHLLIFKESADLN